MKTTYMDTVVVCFTEWQAKRVMVDLGELQLLREQNAGIRSDLLRCESDLFRASLVEQELSGTIAMEKKRARRLRWTVFGVGTGALLSGIIVGVLL